MNKSLNYQLNYLSEKFYNDYPTCLFPEIESKNDRPYMVMLIRISDNLFAIPFRTNVKHKFSYKFSHKNKQGTQPGLDFTKAIVIKDNSYIGIPARVNDFQYKELDIHSHFIISKFTTYIQDYIKLSQGLLPVEREKDFRYSTLKYFHKELGLE